MQNDLRNILCEIRTHPRSHLAVCGQPPWRGVAPPLYPGSLTHSVSLSLSLSLTHTQSLSLSHSQTHSHSISHTLSAGSRAALARGVRGLSAHPLRCTPSTPCDAHPPHPRTHTLHTLSRTPSTPSHAHPLHPRTHTLQTLSRTPSLPSEIHLNLLEQLW